MMSAVWYEFSVVHIWVLRQRRIQTIVTVVSVQVIVVVPGPELIGGLYSLLQPQDVRGRHHQVVPSDGCGEVGGQGGVGEVGVHHGADGSSGEDSQGQVGWVHVDGGQRGGGKLSDLLVCHGLAGDETVAQLTNFCEKGLRVPGEPINSLLYLEQSQRHGVLQSPGLGQSSVLLSRHRGLSQPVDGLEVRARGEKVLEEIWKGRQER